MNHDGAKTLRIQHDVPNEEFVTKERQRYLTIDTFEFSRTLGSIPNNATTIEEHGKAYLSASLVFSFRLTIHKLASCTIHGSIY